MKNAFCHARRIPARRWILVLLLFGIVMPVLGKTEPTIITREEIANARRNVERHDWAREQLESLKEKVAKWVAADDETLWRMLPSQSIPRGIHLNVEEGCPRCGRQLYKHGNYPWEMDIWERPWKIECPNCGVVLPTNDWVAYWNSGRGEDLRFDPGKADRSLLFNTEHPDPEDPLHKWGVTDGTGFVDEDGDRFFIIGYYSHWFWYEVVDAIDNLSMAYVLSGDPLYARKCLVLLDRLADLYPEMDLRPYGAQGYYNSDCMSGRGRIIGRIWECGQMNRMVVAYDRVFDGVEESPELVAFLSKMARQTGSENPKDSPAAIRRHIEDGFVREVIRGVYEGDIRGNIGMHHRALTNAAVCLDDPFVTPEALEWIFRPDGGQIPQVLVGRVDRDGVGSEGSPGYSLGWTSWLEPCAVTMHRYKKWDEKDIIRDYPQYANMYKSPYLMTALDKYTPAIGDYRFTGNPEMHWLVTPPFYLKAWRLFEKDLYGRIALHLQEVLDEELRGNVTDAEPEKLLEELRKSLKGQPPFELDSNNLNGYGLATLRSGDDEDRRAAWLYYGRNTGHGHADRLNWGLFYKGTDILPDLGYPEFSDNMWPKRGMWTINTVSHNTVAVDGSKQYGSWTGHCRDFAETEWVRTVDVASPDVYNIEEYRRTLVMVDVDDEDSYVVDFFRCAGGREHVFSFHAAEGEVSTHGAEFVEQQGGSYAGPEIGFGEGYDGPEDGNYLGSGFSWLSDVSRSREPEPGWAVEYDLVDTWGTFPEGADLRLRCSFLSPVDEAAIASGHPPDNKPGNPERLRYILNCREMDDPNPFVDGLRSLFVSVVEPYEAPDRKLRGSSRIDLGLDSDDLSAVAVRVELADGRVDYVLSSNDPDKVWKLGDGIRAAGGCVVIRSRDGELLEVAGSAVSSVRAGNVFLQPDRALYEGTVTGFQKDPSQPAWIDLDVRLPRGKALAGRMLRVFNDGVRDACYTVESVENIKGGSRVQLGRLALTRDFKDHGDYSKGYVFNLSEGDRAELALLTDWKREGE